MLSNLHIKLSHSYLSVFLHELLSYVHLCTYIRALFYGLWSIYPSLLQYKTVLIPMNLYPDVYLLRWLLPDVSSSIGAFNILVPYHVHINFTICLSSRVGVKDWGGTGGLDMGYNETIDQFEGIYQLYTVFQSIFVICFHLFLLLFLSKLSPLRFCISLPRFTLKYYIFKINRL